MLAQESTLESNHMPDHVCPIWVGRLMAHPLRKLLQNPRKLVGSYVKEGMTVLDLGCAMGFFSLAMAKMVGPQGRVVAVDVQPGMIDGLKHRATRAELDGRIEARVCRDDSLQIDDLGERVDFALAFAVVHEVPRPEVFFDEIHAALKPGGRLFMAEPKGHVDDEQYRRTIETAERAGFSVLEERRHYSGRGVLFERK